MSELNLPHNLKEIEDLLKDNTVGFFPIRRKSLAYILILLSDARDNYDTAFKEVRRLHKDALVARDEIDKKTWLLQNSQEICVQLRGQLQMAQAELQRLKGE